jgi:pimeloyl-ACP methyl ester carboxylesterase
MTFTNHIVGLSNGRKLALSETGDRNGVPLLLCHPAPGSRLLDPDPTATAKTGIRLIGFDRPGYGRSTSVPRFPIPTIGDYADDIAAALAQLGLERTAVIGWSAGGRVALALAARHPSLVGAVAVVGTPAPNDQVKWIPDDYAAEIDNLVRAPEMAIAALSKMFDGMAADPTAALALLGNGPAEQAALGADPSRKKRLEPCWRKRSASAARVSPPISFPTQSRLRIIRRPTCVRASACSTAHRTR